MTFSNPVEPRYFNPTRLRMALGLRKLTREEFAQQSAIPDETMRALCLRGEFPEPENELVAQIAQALEFPVKFFYQGNDDNTLDDAHFEKGITFRFGGGAWEIVCDRCDAVVSKGSTEAIAYDRAVGRGLLRGVKMGHDRWDLCARCAGELGKGGCLPL